MSNSNVINSKKIIIVKNIVKYFGYNFVLDKVFLEVNRGEVVVIIGLLGFGKSIFLCCFNYLERINLGYIEIDGFVIEDKGLYEKYKKYSLKEIVRFCL